MFRGGLSREYVREEYVHVEMSGSPGNGGRPCETNTLRRINDLDCVSALLLADKPLSSSRDDTPITDIDGNRKRDYSV